MNSRCFCRMGASNVGAAGGDKKINIGAGAKVDTAAGGKCC